jgi:glycyl-tRNA synthetase
LVAFVIDVVLFVFLILFHCQSEAGDEKITQPHFEIAYAVYDLDAVRNIAKSIAKKAFDIEYEFPFGWQECESIHNRTDFDLGRHQQFSKKKIDYFDEQAKERFMPYIVETSAGCDRTLLVIMADAYRSEGDRVFLAVHPKVAAYKAAIFPLMKKPELLQISEKLFAEVSGQYRCLLDESGSIGKRYYRQDEIGTPFCLTVDFDSVEKGTVTVRHRDTKKQDKVELANVMRYLQENIANWKLEV